MGYPTNIEWCDATWNPFGGCSVLSPGCTNCYAMKLAGTRLAHLPLYAGTTSPSKAGPVFNGTLTAAPDDHDVWTWPLRWKGAKQPKGGGSRSRIFVGDMSDLFHVDRDPRVIDRVFAVAACAPQHDFLILTKRAARMRAYVEVRPEYAIASAFDGVQSLDQVRPWPLPNVWLGVSCEDQAAADERVPHLLATPAAVRFVSAEPLLGPIDFAPPADETYRLLSRFYGPDGFDESGSQPERVRQKGFFPRVDWIIAGGESGPHARPMHPQWARDIRDQCAAAGTPFFFKQWGEWAPVECAPGNPTRTERVATWWNDERWDFDKVTPTQHVWEEDEPDVWRFGSRASGRTLDGVTHDARPR